MTSLDDNSSNMNDDSENSRMSFVSNNSENPEMVSTSFENRINTPSEIPIERASLEEEYNKRPYLDGTWFVPDLSSSIGKVYGICQTCKIEHNKHSVISGSLYSSSNFKTHLKVRCFELIILIMYIHLSFFYCYERKMIN